MQHQTLGQALESHAQTQIGLTYIDSARSERVLSYSLLHRRAIHLLGCFQNQGLRVGDELVLFSAANCVLIEALWACLLGGIIPVLLAANARPECRRKLRSVLKTLRTPALFTDLSQFARLSPAGSDGATSGLPYGTRTLIAERIDANGAAGIVHASQAHDVALIQFSSGSTGEPKGVALTHGNILSNIRGICERSRITSEDTTLSWMPLNHDMGLVGFHILPLVANCRQHILPTDLFARRPLLWLEKAAEKRATLLGSPNFGYWHYLRAFRRTVQRGLDLSAVRLIFNGGEPISPDLCGDFISSLAPHGLSRRSIFPAYGLAEATLAVATPMPDTELHVIHAERDSLAVGKAVRLHRHPSERTLSFVALGCALNGSALRIVDDDNRPLPDGHVGHVQIRGANVAHGYYTAGGTAVDGHLTNGWSATGDIGTCMGSLFIVGRSKDTIVVNGQNFHPHDLEWICAAVPGVETGKVACLGFRAEGATTDSVVAFLQFRGAPAQFMAIARRVKIAVNESTGLMLADVLPVRALPTTSSGKIQRFALRDMVARRTFEDTMRSFQSGNAAARLRSRQLSAIERRLTKICQEAIERNCVSAQDNLFDLGADSLALVVIHQGIESAYPNVLKLEDFLRHPTIASLAHFIDTSLREPVPAQSISHRAPPPVGPEPVGWAFSD